jgi:NAD(P)-dependent dehydrogenase (short-subunit alcohol dehydrogenase family)
MGKSEWKDGAHHRLDRRRWPHGRGKAGQRWLAFLVHGRDRGRGEQVVASINAGDGAAEFLEADISALAEVQRLADAVQRTTQRLNLLINNAGIGSGGPHGTRQTSADRYELRFAVNYLASFLLTCLLLPLLTKSAPARIVNVSSLGQQALDFTDIMLTREYSGIRAYRQSKLAQILFTIDLAQELEGSGITVNALHPATFMNTKMVRDFGTPRSTVEEGALAILKLANSAEVEGQSGLYFNGQEEARADAQAYDPQARQRLKRLSLDSRACPFRKLGEHR